MTRSAIIHVALLGALLAAAYITWTREPDSSSDDIPLLSARAGLDRVVYNEPDRKVVIERRKDDLGSYHWITVEKWETPPPPPPPPAPPKLVPPKPDEAKKPGDAAKKPDAVAKKPEDAAKKPDEAAKKPEETKPAPKPAPKKIKKVQAFIGSQSAEELMKSLAKLSAMRSLGKAEGKKLEGFGLKKGDRGLVLEFKGSKKELNLGDNTYGNMDRYVQDKADGRVYVVEPRYLGDFPYAEFRLKDTGLTRVERVEIEKVQVAAKDKKKVLVQRHNNTPQKAFWSDEAAPDKSRLLYGNWVDKLTRLSVAEYLPPDEAPKGLTEVLAVAYRGKGDTLDEVRLYRGPPAMPAADKGKPRAVTADAYAKSRHTRALVKINGTLLEEILRDLDSILK